MGIIAVATIFVYNVIWDVVGLLEELSKKHSDHVFGRLFTICVVEEEVDDA
jgi:hypothetical protein